MLFELNSKYFRGEASHSVSFSIKSVPIIRVMELIFG
ncbi:hypothetical protein A5834_002515, partial [Enterococcus faecium]